MFNLRSIFFVFLYLSISNCKATKQDSDLQKTLVDENKTKWNLETLITIAQKPNVTSSIDLVQYLPDAMHQSFLLNYASTSSQGASPDRPRVIMYSMPDGWNVLADHNRFEDQYPPNTDLLFLAMRDPNQESDLVEAIQFNTSKPNMETVEINFKKPVTQKVERNPKKCTGCHGAKVRLMWSPYAEWYGSYHGSDDALKTFEGEKSISMAQQYRKFITDLERKKSEKKDSLYLHLKYLNTAKDAIKVNQLDTASSYRNNFGTQRFANYLDRVNKIWVTNRLKAIVKSSKLAKNLVTSYAFFDLETGYFEDCKPEIQEKIQKGFQRREKIQANAFERRVNLIDKTIQISGYINFFNDSDNHKLNMLGVLEDVPGYSLAGLFFEEQIPSYETTRNHGVLNGSTFRLAKPKSIGMLFPKRIEFLSDCKKLNIINSIPRDKLFLETLASKIGKERVEDAAVLEMDEEKIKNEYQKIVQEKCISCHFTGKDKIPFLDDSELFEYDLNHMLVEIMLKTFFTSEKALRMPPLQDNQKKPLDSLSRYEKDILSTYMTQLRFKRASPND